MTSSPHNHSQPVCASELLPCPFCGPGQSMVDPWYDDVSKRWAIGCGRCGASSGRSIHAEGSKEAAIKSWNTRSPAQCGVQCASDPEASLPTYGNIPWDQLGRDVVQAQTDRRHDFAFDPNCYPGHQMVGINFNSLARIVDKYRLVPNAAQAAPETGLNWALSDEAKKHIEEIERNIREAPQNIARAQGLIGGTHLCGHGVMAVNCPTCSISSAHSPCEAGK